MTFALVDANSFYCSCERVFHPQTRKRPIIVLSNNDGCAISFSREAKAVGFGEMCEPYYKLQDRIRQHKVAVFSSNYALYDDMSRRMMSILDRFTSQLEIYSVDEAFLNLDGMDHLDLLAYGKTIRKDILRQTGLPVGVGISQTKVLSKVANKMTKYNDGVWVMNTPREIDETLKKFPVRDIWGIGSASVGKLHMLKIKTAYDFKMFKDDNIIQKLLSKTGRQVQEELRGVRCLEMEALEDKKNIATTRSFGSPVFDKKELREAVATFCTKAAEKLRGQKSVCFGLTVFVHTNRFRDYEQYYGQDGHTFHSGTSNTLKMIEAAHEVLERIFRSGPSYKKAGVILNHIVPTSENQLDLFNPDPFDNDKLTKVMDTINKKFGPQSIKSAACGLDPKWKLLCEHKSAKFTTNWKEILTV